jgi:hypothetical protein
MRKGTLRILVALVAVGGFVFPAESKDNERTPQGLSERAVNNNLREGELALRDYRKDPTDDNFSRAIESTMNATETAATCCGDDHPKATGWQHHQGSLFDRIRDVDVPE